MDVDFGLLIVRLALGPMIIAHGYNKMFGSGGLAGTTRWFEGLGLRPARVHAVLASTLEMVTGALVIAGFLMPAACAALVGLMAVAAVTDHKGKGYFMFRNGCEYVVLVAMVAVGVASTGPGAWSFDHALGLDLAGVWWAVGAGVLGLAAAGLLVAVSMQRQVPVEPA
jgi:putative oxidoreductase